MGKAKRKRRMLILHNTFALGQGTSTNKSLRRGINNFIKLPDSI